MTDVRTLTKSEERQILDAAPDALVVVDSDGTIIFANKQTVKLFGWSADELIGQSLDLLIPERFRAAHGHHVAHFAAAPVSRPMGSGLELFGRRRDGSELQIEVSLSPVRTERGVLVSAALRDISERKQMEALTKVTSDRLTSAVESIEDAFAIFDADDRLVQCNSVYRAFIGGRLSGDLIGRGYEEILTAWTVELDLDETQRASFQRERLERRHDAQASFDVRTRDGRSLRVIDRRTPEGGLVKTIWDLTDDVQTAEELRQARLAAEAGSAAKSEFLSSMSHELRTPLNAILGVAQLLEQDRKEPLSARQKARARQVIKGGEHLLRLIDDILDLARIEAGRVSISTEPIDVQDVVEETLGTLTAAARRLDVTIKASPASTRPTIVADRTRLVQILMNFGSNAIKYNRPGGTVSIAVTTPSARRVRITVSDTGFGIPLEQQAKLFQPFQRAGQETGPIEGTGIGLVITERLAGLMSGLVGFKSTPGVGSSFWVELPSSSAAYPSVFPAPAPAPEPSAPRPTIDSGTRRKIVYIEDNPANIALMEDVVDGLDGLELVAAPTAEMGIELAREVMPDMIILDINLPGLSGFDALAALRQDERTRHIPVVALTAAASERDRKRGLDAGFDRYLTKPVKLDELLGALDELLDR
ncbi:MAG: PAS domain S-box protein [Polyangiaceae bacterium]